MADVFLDVCRRTVFRNVMPVRSMLVSTPLLDSAYLNVYMLLTVKRGISVELMPGVGDERGESDVHDRSSLPRLDG